MAWRPAVSNSLLGLLSLCLVAFSMAGCGEALDEPPVFAFDTSALDELGVESLLVQAFMPHDVEGEEIDCDVLLNDPSDTSDLVQAASSLLEDVDYGSSSMVLVMPELPPGETWFLVIGFSGASGGGSVEAAGCGRATIDEGSKATVVVLMEPVD